TNAQGSRHRKRWQDVLELLDAGISVYTTLNVQHVESLNDLVAKITGVVLRETVPDSTLERADEIELVDLPPDALLERLQEGKVYVAEQAQEAVKHFFRKGNLIALRELALRRTADRVDEQMQAYMRDHAIGKTWPVAERILVCVSPSPFSPQLVRAGHRLARRLGAGWIVAYVETPAHARLSQAHRRRGGPPPPPAQLLRPPVRGPSRSRRPDPPPRRIARRGDRDAQRTDDERGDPRLRARAQCQQGRHRQAGPRPLEAHPARLRRGRAGPRKRRHRHPRGQRRGRACAGAPAPAASPRARLG